MMRCLSTEKIILFLIIIIGCGLWFIPGYLDIKNAGHTLFFTPDPFYHARRVLITVNNFPNLPAFDYYISYPTGGYCIWPPLFDFIASFISYVLFLGHPNNTQIEWVCAVMPILWGVLVVLLTYKVAKNLFGPEYGLLSAFITACLPVTSFYARLGSFDHHIAEEFGLLLIFFVLTKKDLKEVHKWILLGLSFGISLLLWQGAILFIGITFLILFIYKDFDSFISFLIGLLIILPFSINTHYVDSPFSHRGLSLLHISLLLIASFILLIGYFLKRRKIFAIPFIFSFVILILLLFHSQSFLNGIFFILKNDPWLKTILEFQPLIIQSGYFDNLTVKRTIGPIYYVWPFILILLFIEKKNREKSFICFVVFCLFTGLLSFTGRRYGIWFVPFLSMLTSVLLLKIYYLFRNRIGLIAGTTAFILSFVTIDFSSYKRADPFPSFDEINACRYINDSLLSAGSVLKPKEKPKYGIMCFWDNGHYIIYMGQKPVSASNFGNDVPNFHKVNHFFLTRSEHDAITLLKDFNCPYVYISGVMRIIYNTSKYLDLKPQYFLNLYYTKDKTGKPITIMEPNLNGVSTTTYRLGMCLGTGFYYENNFFEPYRHFRLRFFSGNVRIFEYVKGAVLKGRTKPNLAVKINYEVRLPNISFNYFDSLNTDEKGNFEVTVPYPTGDTEGYKVLINNNSILLKISEEDIINGDTIYIKNL
uniref:Archaeal glycosylation protein B peripheral domain-containing protein n=1 Tax=candidate division WOR-3 bacterium TaxID=2052148 RepID=A0A7V1EIU0_UNCW3